MLINLRHPILSKLIQALYLLKISIIIPNKHFNKNKIIHNLQSLAKVSPKSQILFNLRPYHNVKIIK
jgi:hypothetical protein